MDTSQNIKVEVGVENMVENLLEEEIQRMEFKVEIKEEPLREYIQGEDPQIQEVLSNNHYVWIKLEQQHQSYCNNCGINLKEFERRTIITRRYNPRYNIHRNICQQQL